MTTLPVFRFATRTRVRVALVAIVAVVVLAGAGVIGRGSGGDPPSRVRFLAAPPPAAPASNLLWWEPVNGEPLGVAVDGDDVAADALDEVRLIDAATGRTRWTAPVAGVRDYRPALGGNRVAATTETALVLLDRADGARIAAVAYPGPGPAAVFADAGSGGVVIAASETGQVVAIDARNGAPLWSSWYPGTVTVAPRGDATTVVMSWHGGPGTVLRAFDTATGEPRWEAPLAPRAGAPLLAENAVLVAYGDVHSSLVRAFDLATGRVLWQQVLSGWWEDELEGAVDATTAYLVDGMGTVFALDRATGSVRWRQETGRSLWESRLVLTPGSVVFASDDDELMVLDRADGRLRLVEPHGAVMRDMDAIRGGLVMALRLAAPSRIEARPNPELP